MTEMQKYLNIARKKCAADLHIVAGAPPMMRLKGELVPVSSEIISSQSAKKLCYSLLNHDQIFEFEASLDIDFMSTDIEHNRYRVNISYNNGNVGAVLRLLPKEPMTLESIKLPDIVWELTNARKGLILITGSTSQGKTTTMASMIDEINKNQRKHIITIEDPVEYVYENKKSIIRQREVGKDTESFKRGLRAALRQDPDIIVIGEMRDYDTIKIALTAAETGILVFSSLHIISIDKIIERLLSYAPDGSDGHIRALIAESLLGIIHQELLTTNDGGKQVACEILICTNAVRHVLKKKESFHLRNLIQMGKSVGMQTMRMSLDPLFEEGIISSTVYNKILENYLI